MPRTILSNMPLAALEREIARRQKLLPKLIAQRDALNREIAGLQGLGSAATVEFASRTDRTGPVPIRRC